MGRGWGRARHVRPESGRHPFLPGGTRGRRGGEPRPSAAGAGVGAGRVSDRLGARVVPAGPRPGPTWRGWGRGRRGRAPTGAAVSTLHLLWDPRTGLLDRHTLPPALWQGSPHPGLPARSLTDGGNPSPGTRPGTTRPDSATVTKAPEGQRKSGPASKTKAPKDRVPHSDNRRHSGKREVSRTVSPRPRR